MMPSPTASPVLIFAKHGLWFVTKCGHYLDALPTRKQAVSKARTLHRSYILVQTLEGVTTKLSGKAHP